MFRWIYIAVITFITNVHVTQSADTTYMNTSITDYFSDTRNHEVNPAYKTRAKKFIHDEFKRFGLETEYHHFVMDGMNFTNVIGIRKGKNFGTQSDKIIGVCAHYDTVRNTKGVDDNGSGVAAMLEVARQLDAMHADNEHTVIFLAPDLEEYGLLGSEHFVTEWIPQWFENFYRGSSSNIKPLGAIVLDSVMNYNTTSRSQSYQSDQMSYIFPETFKSLASDDYEGDFIALIFRNLSDAELAQGFKGAWMQDDRKMFEIEEFPLPIETKYDPLWPQFRQFFRSDHYNFWTDTIPAIFLSDTDNFRGDIIQCYHNPCDKVEVMLTDENVAFLGKTADAIVSTIVKMSGGF